MTLLRVEVRERGQAALPALDVDGQRVVIGSSPDAAIRLPAETARPEHVRVERGRWIALEAVLADGRAAAAGEGGAIGDGLTFAFGGYEVRVAMAPAGAAASPPQRTASLARELVRSLLGSGAAPSLEVLRGPAAGARRALPPPVATLVIGRGDEATWVILDEDLSRVHAEVVRGWDGVTVRDLGSKNGTRLDGAVIAAPTLLRDGATIELGKVVLRFRDPAERHLGGVAATPPARPRAAGERAPASPPLPPRASPWPFAIAAVIAGAALAGLAWMLAS